MSYLFYLRNYIHTMRYILTVLIITLLLHFNAFSQNHFITPSEEYGNIEITDTAQQEDLQETKIVDEKITSVETGDTSFVSGNDTTSQDEAPAINPFLAEEETASLPEPQDISKKPKIDILVDLSVGMNSTLFEATPEIKSEPETFSTGTKLDFIFEAGVMIPFLKRFYAGIFLRYFGLKYNLSDSIPGVNGSYSTIDTEESLHFLSVPIKLGANIEFNIFTPYVFAEFQPAYLTSAVRHTSTENYTIFPDSALLFTNPEEDKDITEQRERHQIFAGAGVGLDISYGYGSVYLEGGVMFALREPGIGDSSPVLKSSEIRYFPFSLGVRFFL